MTKLFGTSGVRGPADTLFTQEFSFRLGVAFANFLSNHQQFGPVCVGIDNRVSSPRIQSALLQGLTLQGREVVNLGVVPVPATHYAHLSGPFAGAIMVTGSHIDIKSNGVKFFALKEEINKSHESEIESLFENVSPQSLATKYQILNTDLGFTNYLENLLSHLEQPVKFNKIVLDTGNGGQTEVIKTLFREANIPFVAINDHLQEPLLSRDTESDGSFQELSEKVISEKADLGVGFDSDGDRLVLVDHEGSVVPGDYLGSLICKYFAAESIVCPVNVSNVVHYLSKEVFRTKVGSPYVIEKMKDTSSIIGFESNGGVIHGNSMYSRDGGMTLVRALNILTWTNKSLKDLTDQFPHFINSKPNSTVPLINIKNSMNYQSFHGF
jgi:phosphomannomutase